MNSELINLKQFFAEHNFDNMSSSGNTFVADVPTMKWPESLTLDQLTTKETDKAIKYDNGKTDWQLMPFEAIEEINKVLEFGAKKYSAFNWAEGSGFRYSRIINSLLRHIFAYMRGEDKDPESGLSHLAHAGCNIVFLLYYNKYKDRYNNDDRYKQSS